MHGLLLVLISVSVCLVTNVSSAEELTDFKNGSKFVFSTKGNPKAKGLNITINYPKSWKAVEGDRPTTVKKFISNYGKGYEAVMLNIFSQPENTDVKITSNDFYKYFTPNELMCDTPTGSSFVSFKRTNILSRPALVFEFETLVSSVKTHYTVHMFIYKNMLIKFTGYVLLVQTSGEASTKETIKNNKKIIQLIVDSVNIS
jgi:hypothetical protein